MIVYDKRATIEEKDIGEAIATLVEQRVDSQDPKTAAKKFRVKISVEEEPHEESNP